MSGARADQGLCVGHDHHRIGALPSSPQLPLYLVLAFGAYLFLQLIYGVVTFRTVPDEYESLKIVRFICFSVALDGLRGLECGGDCCIGMEDEIRQRFAQRV